MNTAVNSFDVIIIGGGIAGLWTLAHLKSLNYHCILLEKNQLGSGQSMASQGIIHGGSKYALSGVISKATNNISQMPLRWQQALNGQASVDLSGVKLLSDAQYLVPSSGIDGQLLSFLGSKSMASFTEKVKAAQLPAAYRQAGIDKNCFRLNEMVLDTESLFQVLAKRYGEAIFQADIQPQAIEQSNDGVTLYYQGQTLTAKRLVLAAGNGNQDLPASPMQQRPLKMLMLKSQHLSPIYAHFIGRSSKPLLTISSHVDKNGQAVWYLGGNLAEEGVALSDEQHIDKAQSLLKKLLPSLKLDDASWRCLSLCRAEPKQNSLLRPDDAFVEKNGAILTGWPTKLALAPRFAEQVAEQLDIEASGTRPINLALNKARVAALPWNHDE